jgi:hypothetical protein
MFAPPIAITPLYAGILGVMAIVIAFQGAWVNQAAFSRPPITHTM